MASYRGQNAGLVCTKIGTNVNINHTVVTGQVKDWKGQVKDQLGQVKNCLGQADLQNEAIGKTVAVV